MTSELITKVAQAQLQRLTSNLSQQLEWLYYSYERLRRYDLVTRVNHPTFFRFFFFFSAVPSGCTTLPLTTIPFHSKFFPERFNKKNDLEILLAKFGYYSRYFVKSRRYPFRNWKFIFKIIILIIQRLKKKIPFFVPTWDPFVLVVGARETKFRHKIPIFEGQSNNSRRYLPFGSHNPQFFILE